MFSISRRRRRLPFNLHSTTMRVNKLTASANVCYTTPTQRSLQTCNSRGFNYNLWQNDSMFYIPPVRKKTFLQYNCIVVSRCERDYTSERIALEMRVDWHQLVSCMENTHSRMPRSEHSLVLASCSPSKKKALTQSKFMNINNRSFCRSLSERSQST